MNNITPEATRDEFIRLVKRALFGPSDFKETDWSNYTEDEKEEVEDLEATDFQRNKFFVNKTTGEEIVRRSPIFLYNVGVLYPQGTSHNHIQTIENVESKREENVESEIFRTETIEKEEKKTYKGDNDDEIEEPEEYDRYQPSSVAASFRISENINQVKVTVKGGIYSEVQPNVWMRNGLYATFLVDLEAYDKGEIPLGEKYNNVVLHIGKYVQKAPVEEKTPTKIVTIYVSNGTVKDKETNLSAVSLFQTQVYIEVPEDTLHPYNEYASDDYSAELLYHKYRAFSVGHGCDTYWDDENKRIVLELFPIASVIPNTPDIGEKYAMPMREPIFFGESIDSIKAELNEKTKKYLESIINDYEIWVKERTAELGSVPLHLTAYAEKNIEKCVSVVEDMKEGLKLLQNNKQVLHCFQLMSYAMFLQSEAMRHLEETESEEERVYDFSPDRTNNQGRSWRPFQIAFILANLKSIVAKEARTDMVDIIWMPTGGGKTEAYLGLAAFTILWERKTLMESKKAGKRVARSMSVLMRYTLRLLTSQQFERAASMICALDYIRKKNLYNKEIIELSEKQEITIGAWLGGATTPNTVAKAGSKLNTNSNSKLGEVFIIKRCPWCGSPCVKDKKQINDKLLLDVKCSSEFCVFGGQGSRIPALTIDEMIYENPPNMVIGTIDKLAAMVDKKEPLWLKLFGLQKTDKGLKRLASPPALFIQDELHLISGPLGSLNALYEVSLEELCKFDEGVAPKIIGATATIKSYQKQVEQLYGRSNSRLFPPPALNVDDSFFSVKDSNAVSRKFVAISSTGFGRKTQGQVRILAAALHASSIIDTIYGKLTADPWWTNLVFFQSKRAIAGAISGCNLEMQNNMRRLYVQAAASNIRRDYPKNTELTANSEVVPQETLDKLKISKNSKNALDMCFATSIIEVGLDIPRLGLVTVMGQPKTFSQYIQVTGRVGRSNSAPAVALVVLSNSNVRDRSNYETFTLSHKKLYSSVEGVNITPYTPQALSRGLAAAMTILGRFMFVGDGTPYSMVSNKDFTKPWLFRAQQFGNEEYFNDEIERLKKIASRYNTEKDKGWDEILSKEPLESVLNSTKWHVPMSMRSVDDSSGMLMSEVGKDSEKTYYQDKPVTIISEGDDF